MITTMEKMRILSFYARKRMRHMLRLGYPRRVGGRLIIDGEKGNNLVRLAIKRKAPFMLARFGAIEMQCINRYFSKGMGLVKDYRESHKYALYNNAGFFPKGNSELMDKFAELMIKSSKELDYLALLGSYDEDYIIRKQKMKSVRLLNYNITEPFGFTQPWTEALKGKRVLVVHPFKRTIISQYQKREKIFPGREVLPEFDLHVVKAVQSIAGEPVGFATWFDALDAMTEEISKVDFDMAIIGCGAYGFPLAARIKRMRKMAIHMGGATQLLFGIRGGRWDYYMSNFYNDAWVRPCESETPKNYKSIEDGCYW